MLENMTKRGTCGYLSEWVVLQCELLCANKMGFFFKLKLNLKGNGFQAANKIEKGSAMWNKSE